MLIPISICIFFTAIELNSPQSNATKIAHRIGLILQGFWLIQMGLSFCSWLAQSNAPTIRIEDAIEILEYVLKLREEKLGTANADFDDAKKRLTDLLKEAGRSRNRKAKSLQNLIDPNSKRTKKEPTKKRSGFGFRL